MDAVDLMRGLNDAIHDAKKKNMKIKEFKLSRAEYDLLFDWFLRNSPAKTMSKFNVLPQFGGVRIRVI